MHLLCCFRRRHFHLPHRSDTLCLLRAATTVLLCASITKLARENWIVCACYCNYLLCYNTCVATVAYVSVTSEFRSMSANSSGRVCRVVLGGKARHVSLRVQVAYAQWLALSALSTSSTFQQFSLGSMRGQEFRILLNRSLKSSVDSVPSHPRSEYAILCWPYNSYAYSADQSVPALLIPIRTHPIRTAVTLSVFIDSYSHTVL